MMVDDFALFCRQGADADGQVFNFIVGQEVAAWSVVVAPAPGGGDAAYPFLVFLLHGFIANVDTAQEGAVRFEHRTGFLEA